jgi:hypothetical protein
MLRSAPLYAVEQLQLDLGVVIGAALGLRFAAMASCRCLHSACRARPKSCSKKSL